MITNLLTRLILFLAASASFFRHARDGYNCTSALNGDAWDDEWINKIEMDITK